jgi:hypothetical protein
MHPDDLDRELDRIHRWLEAVRTLIQNLKLRHRHHAPAAPGLAGSFTLTGDSSMNAVLIATLPTTRKDLSALSPTDIASITFQKTSGSPAGPEVTLATNTAAPGAGLTLEQITVTDTSSVDGDSYTCFVTDTHGNVGDLSNAVVNTVVVVPPLAAPSAPSLAATFT